MQTGPHHDEDGRPVMFHGIRYGRPGQSKFDAKVFLLILLIAAALTVLIDLFMPAAPPRPAAPDSTEGAREIRIVPSRPAPPRPASPRPAP